MGCGASNEAKDTEEKKDRAATQETEKDDNTTSRTDGKDNTASDGKQDFDGGVAPSDDASPPPPNDDSAPANANSSSADQKDSTDPALSAFTFGEAAADGGGVGGGFVAFGGGGDAFSGHDEDDDAAAAAKPAVKPRRIAVSDECADPDEDQDWEAPVVDKSDEDKRLIRSVLKHNPLLQNLDGHDLDVVVNAMTRMDFPAGHRVLEQGGEGGMHYYVIAAGQVEIIKNNQLVCTFSEGQGFGEMELMYVQPCVATVRCRVDTKTWAIDRKTYKKTVMRLALERRQLYTELLSKIDFLENMTDYERHTLSDALSPVTLSPGENMIRRGEVNEWMFIIVDGVVEVLGGSEGKMEHVTDLERGSCVGELEFLNGHNAVADCVAKTDVRACKLHRDHFELCMGPVTDVLRRTVRQDKYAYYQAQLEDLFNSSNRADQDGAAAHGNAAPAAAGRRRQRHAVSAEVDGDDDNDADWSPPVVEKSADSVAQAAEAIKRCPLFSALSDDDSQIVLNALQPRKFDNEARIIEEGAVPEEAFWYVIAGGSVVLKQKNEDGSERELALLCEGQSFGELDLMYTTPSLTSAVALCDEGVDCFLLDRKTYRRIIMKVTVERRRLYRELLTGVPFLTQLSEPQHQVLADALSPIAFTPGELLARHGHVNEWMYIIVDGVVEVFGADGSKVCDLRRGEMVGELEFLNKHRCVANCVAKTHVKACRLHREHFEACLGPVSGFIDEILKTPKYDYYNKAAKEAVA